MLRRLKVFLIRTFNKTVRLVSVMLFSLSKRREENIKILTSLKDRYSGQRCFIIGNGPSLTAADLEKIALNGDISFAANAISVIFPKTLWRPTYYAVFDEVLPIKIKNYMNEVSSEYKFFRQQSFLWTHNVKGNCVYINTDANMDLYLNPKFSNDASRVVHSVSTVTYATMQLAVHMGFKEIYLLGVDNNYARVENQDGSVSKSETTDNSYFEGMPKKFTKKSKGAKWEMDIAYKAAHDYADKNGIRIYNATRGGMLEEYTRVNFDSLF